MIGFCWEKDFGEIGRKVGRRWRVRATDATPLKAPNGLRTRWQPIRFGRIVTVGLFRASGRISMGEATPGPPEGSELLDRLRGGDANALGPLLDAHRGYLERLVGLRMDPRLRARLDPADVVQQVCLEAVRRIDDYLTRAPMPFRAWLRLTACQCLVDLQRHHVHAECRAVAQEMALPEESSAQLAQRLMSSGTSPSGALMRHEAVQALREALAQLPEADREIILLRNFEELSNHEAAAVLGIEPAAASKRYGRAIFRLDQIFRAKGLTDSSR
jgi:RNA polymerase sigma-70 factor (ECF subfamily)